VKEIMREILSQPAPAPAKIDKGKGKERMRMMDEDEEITHVPEPVKKVRQHYK
jgi:hypothetical protein